MPIRRSPTLVGRTHDLQVLAEALGVQASPAEAADRSRPGPLRAALLAGDAGVGKTRLLTALRDHAAGQGWRVVVGHCLDVADTALPYLPFTEILGRLGDELPDEVAATLERHPALARLQPGRRLLAESATPGDGSLPSRELVEAVPALLEDVAARDPLLVVVEDVHWADRSTLDLLRLLFVRPFATPVALVASYRSDDLHRRHPLRRELAEWSRVRALERHQLAPLPDPDVRRLVRLLHPDPLPEAVVAAIVARAEGNAFFVEELVSSGLSPETLPDDLADVLLVQLDRLGDDAREVVRAVAVAGRRVTHDALPVTTGLEQAALDAAVREAVDRQVLEQVDGDSYAFRHALLAEAVYDDLLPGERARWHTAYAEALADGRCRGTAAELARHARLAGDVATAVRAGVQAGDDAARLGGPDEAAQHYLQALTLVSQGAAPPEEGQAEIAARAAEALFAAGHAGRSARVAREHLEALPADAPPAHRGRLLTALAQALSVIDSDDDAAARASEAVALLADAPARMRASALALQARILAGTGRRDEARQAGVEALALADRYDLPRLATDVLATFTQLDRDRPDSEVQGALEEVIERARAAGARSAELRARYYLGRFHQDRNRFAEAADAFAAAAARGTESGTPWAPYAFEARLFRAVVLQAAGRWDEAGALLATEGEWPPPVPEAMLVSQRAVLAADRGEPDAVTLALSTRPHWRIEGLAALAAGYARIAVHEGSVDPAGAVAAYDDTVGVLGETWRPWFAGRLRLAAVTLGVAATAAQRMSAHERQALAGDAERLYADGKQVLASQREAGVRMGREGQAWAARLDAEWLRWRWAAQLNPPDLGALVDSWRAAELAARRYGHVLDLARVRGRLASVLRAAGRADTAREAADLARQVGTELGARPLLDELVLLGSAPARSAPARGGELTPREREILALVAEGRTNGEIGHQLFISTKTVSVHVSNILAKLEAASRTEAAAVARRRGLLD